MNGLKDISIGSLAKGIRGVTYKPHQLRADVGNDDFFLLRSNNIQNGKIDLSDIQIVDKRCVSEKQRLKKGHIIVCMSNGSRHLVGKSALVDNLNGNYCVGSFCSSFVTNDGINPDFVFQIFRSDNFKFSVDVILSGSAINNLQNKNIEELVFTLPSSSTEQSRIAQILSKADKAIAQTEALIAKYQRIKTGLMQDLLTKGIDEHGNIRSRDTHKFVVKNSIEVPEDWEVDTFKQFCEIIKDGTHLPPRRVSEGIWLLGVSNIIDGEWKITSSDTKVPEHFYAQMHKNWQILIGDVLLAIVGATIGKVSQVPDEFPLFTLQRSVCLLRGKKEILDNNYLRLFIESKSFQRLLWNEVNVTAQPGIYLDTISKFFLPKPPYEEQVRIAGKINSLKENIDSLKLNLSKLQSLKTGLMQDLLSGRVRVNVSTETLVSQ